MMILRVRDGITGEAGRGRFRRFAHIKGLDPGTWYFYDDVYKHVLLQFVTAEEAVTEAALRGGHYMALVEGEDFGILKRDGSSGQLLYPITTDEGDHLWGLFDLATKEIKGPFSSIKSAVDQKETGKKSRLVVLRRDPSHESWKIQHYAGYLD